MGSFLGLIQSSSDQRVSRSSCPNAISGFPKWIRYPLALALVSCAAMAQAKTATTATLAITSSGSTVSTVSAGTVITLTATVKAGATAVSPGLVNFCDANATYCEDVHIIGSAQLTSSGSAVFKFRPGIGSRSYKAVFVGTNTDCWLNKNVTMLPGTNWMASSSPTTRSARPSPLKSAAVTP